MRASRFVMAICTATVLGCGNFRHLLVDISTLSRQLQTTFRRPMTVNVMNGEYLTVGVPMTDADTSASQDERQAFAWQIARFAESHYAQTKALVTISVIFVHQNDYAGVVHVKRSYGQFNWPVNQLRAAGSTAGQQTRPETMRRLESRYDPIRIGYPQ